MSTLLIHGSISSSRLWRRYRDLFPGPVVSPEMIGALGTVAPRQPWTLQTEVDRFAEALLALPEPAVIGAHSYGGLIGCHLALQHPDRVRKIVVHDPVIWPLLRSSPRQRDRDWLDSVGHLSHPMGGGTELWLGRFYDFWFGEGGYAALPADRKAPILVNMWKTFAEVQAAFDDRTTPERWATVRCPVRIARGADSPWPARAVVTRMAELMPDVQVVDVPGGHLGPVTHAEGVREAWARWL